MFIKLIQISFILRVEFLYKKCFDANTQPIQYNRYIVIMMSRTELQRPRIIFCWIRMWHIQIFIEFVNGKIQIIPNLKHENVFLRKLSRLVIQISARSKLYLIKWIAISSYDFFFISKNIYITIIGELFFPSSP